MPMDYFSSRSCSFELCFPRNIQLLLSHTCLQPHNPCWLFDISYGYLFFLFQLFVFLFPCVVIPRECRCGLGNGIWFFFFGISFVFFFWVVFCLRLHGETKYLLFACWAGIYVNKGFGICFSLLNSCFINSLHSSPFPLASLFAPGVVLHAEYPLDGALYRSCRLLLEIYRCLLLCQ